MTDNERSRIEAICKVANVTDIEDLSDGFHTFRQLYYQRMMLFATIVKQNKERAWKSLRHEDGELCFGGGWFIVGIDTPEGSYTYHYEDNYFSLFDCVELDRGKHWDGHTEKDVTRLLSLPSARAEPQLTVDDIETIRIHLNAIKEKLCNQRRYKEAEEYAGIIKRLTRLPSAQPEIIRCKECKHQIKEWREDKRLKENGYWVYACKVISDICGYWAWFGQDNEFCSEAERREE